MRAEGKSVLALTLLVVALADLTSGAPVITAWHASGFPGIGGYATPRSVAPGETVDLHVSSSIGGLSDRDLAAGVG